jgi:hypothetical protein
MVMRFKRGFTDEYDRMVGVHGKLFRRDAAAKIYTWFERKVDFYRLETKGRGPRARRDYTGFAEYARAIWEEYFDLHNIRGVNKEPALFFSASVTDSKVFDIMDEEMWHVLYARRMLYMAAKVAQLPDDDDRPWKWGRYAED